MTKNLTEFLPIDIRATQPGDAPEINKLFIDRALDSAPGYPEFSETRIAHYKKNGEPIFRNTIERIQGDPEHFFMQVALLQDEIAGYAVAEAAPDDPFCWWHGLTVAREYEGLGIGQQLGGVTRNWALSHGRPVRVRIVPANERSMDFFGRQGFSFHDFEEPNEKIPIRFNIMELGARALGTEVQGA